MLFISKKYPMSSILEYDPRVTFLQLNIKTKVANIRVKVYLFFPNITDFISYYNHAQCHCWWNFFPRGHCNLVALLKQL